ncbi:hypothetical protein J3F83DRAFT_758209 [Trichoderma novae-zelandiae]
MDSPMWLEELERLLRETEQRAERERQRAEDEHHRAEDERHRAEGERQRAEDERQRAERERQRADASEERLRPTTLDEYMVACHNDVFCKLVVENRTSPSSKAGAITNPRDKWCPDQLRPWADFLYQQRVTFGTLYDTFSSESRVFEGRDFLAALGNRVSKRPVADEKALEYFLHFSVEDPVRTIVEQLQDVGEARTAFDINDGITFENHPHAISEVSQEVVDRERESPSTPKTPDHRRDLNQLRPDQICVVRADKRRSMVYISEYKAPSKLTVLHLRRGLRPMDVHKEVVNRKTIPTGADEEANFQYTAERLTASAITQTYHYMILSGLEYGLLTNGEAIVFLKIDWAEPGVLYYHLAEPGPEAAAHPDNVSICTAVGQYLAFTLVALGSPGGRREHGQDEREKATEGLRPWAEDFETTLRSIPEHQRGPSEGDSSCYRPTTYQGVDRSPYLLRRMKRRVAKGHADEAPGRSAARGTRRSERLARRPRERDDEQDPPYCTQKCLLGLVDGGPLDARCPNVALHRKRGARTSKRHPVTHSEWLQLLRDQMKQSLDAGIVPLELGGARGVLFKVTLLEYGYTFVSKGTVKAFIRDLQHEAAVYERLKPLQGRCVTVFLGAIDLGQMNKIYYYWHRVYIVHMTLMAWGGGAIRPAPGQGHGGPFEEATVRALGAIHQRGVIHKDVRLPNLLFNPEINSPIVIDFERAVLLEPPRSPLVQVVPNKRKRKPEATNGKKAVPSSRRLEREFARELMMAQEAFLGL